MRSLFHHAAPEPPPVIEPVPTVFPKIEGADIAAVFAGKRVAGDFYDSIRVSPERVLFGLLDVAGRREDTRSILVAAQELHTGHAIVFLLVDRLHDGGLLLREDRRSEERRVGKEC